VNDKPRDDGGDQDPDVGQKQDGNDVLPQMPELDFHAAFKQERRQENDQGDVRRQPIRPLACYVLQERSAHHAKGQAAQHQRNGVGNPKTGRYHSDDGGGDQQPDDELDDKMGLHGFSARIRYNKSEAPRDCALCQS